jgi:glutathione S-transferase
LCSHAAAEAGGTVIVLYQLAISHYCEKIRWALDYKGLDHRTETLLPGLHVAKTKKMGLKRSALPVVRHGEALIQNSSDIITYLDNAFPERSLTPADSTLAREALEWEAMADEEIGPHVRRVCYHQLLEYPDIVVPLLAHDSPWYGRVFFRLMFPKIREQMRRMMTINDTEARLSAVALDAALEKVQRRRAGREFLVGDQFSRADLAVGALLAPLRMPQQYGVPWPRTLPEPAAAVIDAYVGRVAWIDDLYAKYR